MIFMSNMGTLGGPAAAEKISSSYRNAFGCNGCGAMVTRVGQAGQQISERGECKERWNPDWPL